MQVFAYLKEVIVLKLSPIIGVGDSFEACGSSERSSTTEGTWVKELDKYESLCVDDDADEGLPSVDECKARETDGTWRRRSL